MNTVYVNVTAWCDIIKSGCDVICIHMMSCVLCLCYHTQNGVYMIDNLGVKNGGLSEYVNCQDMFTAKNCSSQTPGVRQISI